MSSIVNNNTITTTLSVGQGPAGSGGGGGLVLGSTDTTAHRGDHGAAAYAHSQAAHAPADAPSAASVTSQINSAISTHTAAADPHAQYTTAAEAAAAAPVQSVAGKTGTVTLVKADVGLSNVDNTSDLSKPISTATQTALDDLDTAIAASVFSAYVSAQASQTFNGPQQAQARTNIGAAAATHSHSAADITSGTVDPTRLGSGTSIATKFLRGDSTWQTIGGGGDALTSNPLSQFAATTSAQLAGVISDETGTGALVFANSPTLVTPALGTPSSGTLTNCTGYVFANLASRPTTLSGYGITDAQPLDSDLTSIAALTTTSFGRSLLTQADAAATRTTIGLGDSSTRNVGSAANTVCAGDDSRLSNARTPLSHAHGPITNAGAIGTTPDLFVVTGAGGVLTTQSGIQSGQVSVPDLGLTHFSTEDGLNQVFENIDTALGNRAFTSHNHAASAITSGVIATARLGTGTADNTTYLRGDGTWAAPGGGGATNLSISAHGASTLQINSDTGTDVTLPAATTSLAGLMTADDKSRLDNVLSLLSNAYVTLIATGATNDNVQFSAAADYTVLWWDGTRTNHIANANATKQITSTYSNRELQCYVFEQNASNNLTVISTGGNVVGLIANSHTTLTTVRCGASLQILDVSNCRNLSSIDATVVTLVRMVDATNCRLLTQFADSNRFQSLETLILDGCVHPDLKISYYVAGSDLKNISCRGVAPTTGFASTTVNSTSTVITEHYGIDFNGSGVRELIIEKVFNDLGEESGWIDIRNTPDAATVDTSIATAKGYTVFTI